MTMENAIAPNAVVQENNMVLHIVRPVERVWKMKNRGTEMTEDKYLLRYGRQYLKCGYCSHFHKELGLCVLFSVTVKPDKDGCTEDYIKACEQIQQNS